ncbi:Exo_endo_phos domain-containing protein, partial [Cephalotus follicularis]
ISFVYGLCDYRNRRELWKDLIFMSQQVKSAPWLIMGDFNVSRHPMEQLNGSLKFSKAVAEFNECLNTIEVDDIRSVGRVFTWTNKRGGISDHSPVSVGLAAPWRAGSKPFKFLNLWTSDNRFQELVRSVWGQCANGNPLEVVLYKLRNLKRALKCTFRKPNPCPKKEAIRVELEDLQARLLHAPSDPALLNQEKLLISKLWKVKAEEESYLKQKSRINWLKLGDSN